MINITKTLRLIAVSVLLAQNVSAQTDSIHTYHRHFAEFYVMGGGQFVNFSGLNNRLQKAGIDKLTAGMAGFGVGIDFNFNRWTVGTDVLLTGGYQQDVSATSINGHIYFGYNVLQTRTWALAPEIGIGFQSITVDITRPGTAGGFDNALTNAQNQVELQHGTTPLDAALAFRTRSYLPLFGHVGIKPACKFGYRYGAGDNTWKVRRSDVHDGPRDRASNFYLTLSLSFGRNPGSSPGE